jgi:hypothetical protein
MVRAPSSPTGRAVRAGACAAAFASCTLAPSALGAPKVQGVAEVSGGYTDNAESAPDVPIPGEPPKSGGAFVLLSPGIVVANVTQRSNQRLQYTFTYDLFLQSASESTSSNRLDYRGFFDLSPRVNLTLGATALQSNEYSAILITAPAVGSVNALPPGSDSFLSATVNELMSFDLGPGWRAYEAAAVAEQTPLFDTVAPRTFAPSGRAGIERTFERDAAGVEARADYSIVQGALALDGTPLGVQEQIIGTGVGIWRHDWGRYFTSRVEAGALRLQRLNTDSGLWQPAGAASLNYATESGEAGLAYDHTVTTNPYLGQTLLIDEVRLRGALPLTKKGEILAAASAGYQAGRILDEDANLAAHVDAILGDVGIGWQIAPSILVALRYQHIQQLSDTQVPPLPVSFTRNSILVGTTIKFPPERDMPRAYRAPLRVDSADEIRDVVEPTESVSPTHPGGPGT